MADPSGRFGMELAVLQTMYPEDVSFSPTNDELTYNCDPTTGSTLILRIPGGYPDEGGLPEVISATGPGKIDLRNHAQDAFSNLGLPAGEEALDPIILAFQELLSSQNWAALAASAPAPPPLRPSDHFKTVIITLHHLNNPSKRELALHPTREVPGQPLSGLTKIGHPGIMVFSGPKNAVDAHVSELRRERWQVFRVGYDSTADLGGDEDDDLWDFVHGTGIKEFEDMDEMIEDVKDEREKELLIEHADVM
jgi:hypothetical protein